MMQKFYKTIKNKIIKLQQSGVNTLEPTNFHDVAYPLTSGGGSGSSDISPIVGNSIGIEFKCSSSSSGYMAFLHNTKALNKKENRKNKKVLPVEIV